MTDDKETIERLLLELRQTKAILDDAKTALYSTREFEKHTLVGGVKAVLRELDEERKKTRELEKEIFKLLK